MNFQVETICLQETWLVNNAENFERFKLPDFKLSLNSQGKGKGIATYFKKNFAKNQEVSEQDLQVTVISNEKFDIFNVYRSANNKTLKDRLRKLVNQDKPTLICGDFNSDISRDYPDFLQTLKDLGFDKLNQKPTHDMGRSIDCLFVNSLIQQGAVTFAQIGVSFSDHDLMLVKFGLQDIS